VKKSLCRIHRSAAVPGHARSMLTHESVCTRHVQVYFICRCGGGSRALASPIASFLYPFYSCTISSKDSRAPLARGFARVKVRTLPSLRVAAATGIKGNWMTGSHLPFVDSSIANGMSALHGLAERHACTARIHAANAGHLRSSIEDVLHTID
jgi:hypothetical protein